MLTNSAVTLFRFDEAADDYKRIGTFPAWVFLKQSANVSKGGFERSDVLHIRIARCLLNSVQTGDMAAIGNIPEFDPRSCRAVTCVTDNSFGGVPHWHIEGSA